MSRLFVSDGKIRVRPASTGSARRELSDVGGVVNDVLVYDATGAASWIAPSEALGEVLALADLSDVTAKTGTGTVVAMQVSPFLATPTFSGAMKLNTLPVRFNSISGGACFELNRVVTDTANHIRISSVATGQPSLIESLGGDTHVGLNLVPKGEGEVQQRGHKIPGITVGAEPSTKTTGDFWFNNA